MALVNCTDVRLGLSYTFSENLNSLLAIFWLILSVTFPLTITAFYWSKFDIPVPDFNPDFTDDQLL
jgi:hypothetical protein